jgi:hypothetical protein
LTVAVFDGPIADEESLDRRVELGALPQVRDQLRRLQVGDKDGSRLSAVADERSAPCNGDNRAMIAYSLLRSR